MDCHERTPWAERNAVRRQARTDYNDLAELANSRLTLS
jgi:hypothetical protein